jgi:hypothetical protein
MRTKSTGVVLSFLSALALLAPMPGYARHAKSEATSTNTEQADTTQSESKRAKSNKREHKRLAERPSRSETEKTTTTDKMKTAEPESIFSRIQKRILEREKKTAPGESARSASSFGHAGMVFVHGYTKKNGTKVEGYWRKKEGTK